MIFSFFFNDTATTEIYTLSLHDALPIFDDYTYDILVESDVPITNISFDSIGGTNVNYVSYPFYIGGAVLVTGVNQYDNSTLTDYNVTVTTINSYPGGNATVNIPGSQGYVVNLSNGTYNFAFTTSKYFPFNYTVDVNSSLEYQNYTSYQSIVNIKVTNIDTGTFLNNWNISITNDDTGRVDTAYVNDTIAIFYINATGYDYFIQKDYYQNLSGAFSTTYQENLSLNLIMSFLANFFLVDENTNEPFNISGTDRVRFIVYCTDQTTTTTTINETDPQIPINCAFDKFKFVIEYGTTSYYRNLLFNSNDILNYSETGFNISVYLIDLLTTQSIFNTFVLDDLFTDYDNPKIIVRKIIGDNVQQITGDNADIEDKIGAYLIINHEYLIEVQSDNHPTRLIGTYSADIEGEKIIRLYDIQINPEKSGFASAVSYVTYYDNDTKTAVAKYEDTDNLTSSVTWNLYKDEYGGTLLHSDTGTGESLEFVFNASDYENDTMVSVMEIDHASGHYTYGKTINLIEGITLGIEQYLSPGFLNWFFTLLLGLIAIMATIQTANMVSIVMIGMGALFTLFGWYGLSWSILALAFVVSLLSLLKEESK